MNIIISIVIINYNGKKWLKRCLDSLFDQTYKNFEIIIIDNASSDGSIEYIKQKYPQINLIESHENLGTAEGNNLGYKNAKGEYLLLLNNDTYVESTFLEDFIKAFKNNPKLAVAQSKLVLMRDNHIIDSCGSYWTNSSFLYHVGNGKDESLPLYNQQFPVFSVKSASALIKISVIKEIGLYDKDFWFYYEETDFCHRAWIRGYMCIYWPSAKVYHAVGGTVLTFSNSYMQFHNFKNKLLSFLKNFETTQLLSIIPIYLFLNILLSLSWVLTGKYKHAASLYKAIFWNVFNIRQTLYKRREIQKLRKISDKSYLKICKRNPSVLYYYYLFTQQFEKYKDSFLP